MREYADPGLLVELAVEAEEAGWDGFFVWDHISAAASEPAGRLLTRGSCLRQHPRR